MNDYREIAKLTAPIFEKYQVRKAALFGSMVTDKATPGSDIDVIIDPLGEFDMGMRVELIEELGKILGREVDLSTYTTIHKYYKPRVMKEQVVIYDIDGITDINE